MGARLLNKITTPRIQQVISRPRLFALLQQTDAVPAVWIAGPAGSGKTSLAASYLAATDFPTIWYQVDAGDGDLATFFYYLGRAVTPLTDQPARPLPLLTPEYMMGVETFAIRYFEELFQRLTAPIWLVFDNFQELPDESPVPSILARAIEQAPLGIRLAILSRHDPPPVMTRLLANRLMSIIGNDQLAFSQDECRALISHANRQMPLAEIDRLHRVTRGWIAGLILWLLRGQLDSDAPSAVADSIPEMVFDYFAGEVLERTDKQICQFLLKTALMPYMTVEMAARLTDMSAVDILDDLSRRNFFLENRQLASASYQYHPLFRDFLLQRAARIFDAESLRQLRCRAAAVLADAGLAEEAVALYHQAGNHTAMAELILSQAPVLAAQGRTRTLTAWIGSLPGDLVDHQPWLLFWNGVGLMAGRPADGQVFLTRAFERFIHDHDLAGQIVSWSALIESSMYLRGAFRGMGRWVSEGERLGGLLPTDLDPDTAARFSTGMLASILMHNPSHSEIDQWQARCEALLGQCIDQQILASIGFNLLWSYHWLGQRIKARQLVNQLEALLSREDLSPVNWLKLQWCLALCAIEEGDLSQGHRIIQNAMELADCNGIHFFDFLFLAFGAYGSLFGGDLEAARDYLNRAARVVPPHAIWDIAQHHFLEGIFAMTACDWTRAKHYLERGRRLAKDCGAPFPAALTTCSLAHYFLEQGDLSRAMDELDRVEQMGFVQSCGMIRFQYDLVRADCARVRHDTEAMLTHLQRGFADAAENGLGMPLGIIRPRLAVLCAEALKARIHSDLVADLIRRLKLPPPPIVAAGETWPWPVKIYCLGRLEIVHQGQVIDLGKKPPRKTLALMRLLASRNGQGVARDTVADQLWADADGDRAVQNINTTIHRLRKLIGDDQAVVLENGRLSLNPGLCWVDAWQFESLVEKARSAADANTRMALLSRAIDLYGGHFERLNDDAPWAVGYARDLGKAWISAMTDLEKLLRDAGRIGESDALLQRMRAIDDSADFHGDT